MNIKTIKRGLALALAMLVMINSVNMPYFLNGLGSMTSYASTAVVNATTLNIRSGPGTSYSIVGKATNGSSVEVLGTATASDGSVWNQIQYGTLTGYVLSTYLKTPSVYSYETDFESYLTAQGFPESYKDSLRTLHAEYPNWIFTAQHTNLDWNTVIENESIVGRNLVYDTSVSSWKSTADGAYDWSTSTWPGFDGSSWVAASEDIIKYYMDPRNFLDDKYIFQFLTHAYDPTTQTRENLANMVSGTFLSGSASVSSSFSGSTTSATGTTGTSTSTDGPGSAVDTSSSSVTTVSSGTTVSTSSPSGSTSGSTSGSSSGSSVSLDGPGSVGSSTFNGLPVSLESPSASISRKDASVVMTAAGLTSGPGGSDTTVVSSTTSSSSSSSSATQIGPGYSSGSSSSSSSPSSGSATASYVDILFEAAERSGVNPYVLASMIIQEQGTNGTGRCISGTVSGYEGYYNHFNIEAYSSGSMDAITRGLWYASQSGSYDRPWNSIDKSIIGGALYYGTNYVSVGQDTFYLKKFNVQGDNLYKHQYMTNVQAAASEGSKLAEAYGSSLANTALEFKIPVFLNMPSTACAKPTVDGSPNNKLSSFGVEGFAISPSFDMDTYSYNVTVDTSVSSIVVDAVPISSTASVTGTGTLQLTGTTTDIAVSVTAQNGNVRIYQIHVTKQDGGPTYNSSIGTVTSPSTGSSGSSISSNYGPGYTSGTTSGSASVTISPETTVTSDGPASSSTGSSSSDSSGPGGSTVTIVR